jgi:PKD repeat protein
MVRARLVAVLILSVMLLSAIMPQLAVAAPLAQPVNYSPVNGATEIGPGHTFVVAAFGGTAYATQWQWRTPTGSYALPLYDTGIVVSDSAEATYPEGVFDYGEMYYWHMRVMNDQGEWSAWSAETSFTVIVNSPPSQPENFEPDDGATGVAIPVTLQACEFRDPNAEELVLGERDTHAASQWQVTTTAGVYTTPVLDSGRATSALTSASISLGVLSENTTYYWHVRYQDSYGNWSAYSPETSFTTGTTTEVPTVQQPVNISPFNGADGISPDQKLRASAFVGSGVSTHYASRWQVASSAGAYSSPLYDSGISPNNLVEIALPAGLLDYDKTYFWHVKYQDSTGAWSAWSEETSFTVVENLPPSSPRNTEPLDGQTGIETNPALVATGFSDPDMSAYTALTDSHTASQWQVTTTAGVYTSPVFDSGVASPTTSVTVPKGYLHAGTTYYWHVRYQDSRGNWSGYSEETSFTTKALSVPVASFAADTTEVVAGRDLVTFSDNSTPAAEIDSWSWDFGDGTLETWTADTRPPNGRITHKYTEKPATGDTYTVTLTVYNGAAAAGVVDSLEITVHASPVASFTVTPAAPKAGKDITFTDTSSAGTDIQSWVWLFDDGATETWTTRPGNGQITHRFSKGGEHTVTLTVTGKGDLGESNYNKKINVAGGGGFQFGLWMVAVGVGVVVVIAGVVYLIRARKGAK